LPGADDNGAKLAPLLHQHTNKGDAPAVAGTGASGQASLKNVKGKARRRRQYASTARKPQRRHRHFLRLATLARHFRLANFNA